MDSSGTANIKLLDDSPAEYGGAIEPSFDAHERIATTLSELICTQKGGKFIALEGKWGSGKSTVVKLTTSKLIGQSLLNVRVVAFDAWAHTGDFLRRTFLETLISQLVRHDSPWIREKHWKEVASLLAKKLKRGGTTQRHTISPAAIALTLLLLLVPLGASLLVAGIQKTGDSAAKDVLAEVSATITPTDTLPSESIVEQIPIQGTASLVLRTPDQQPSKTLFGMHWLAGIGLILVLLPLISIFVFYGASKLRRSDRADDYLKLLINKATSESTSETTDSGEPSSVEFEYHFSELMREALDDKDRRLVLVIDNLDRIDQNDAKIIWSTMRTFLHPSEHEQPVWLPKLWVIVPYDQAAIARNWIAENKPDNRSESFLNKTFQITFRVPPPVLTEWRTYFDKALHEAVPDSEEAQRHLCYVIFSRHLDKSSRNATARDIKLFINQIAVLQIACGRQYSLAETALFTVYPDKDQRIPLEIRTGRFPEYPDKSFRDLFSSKLPDHVAAMYFGVDVDSARQLILREPIRTALSTQNAKSLQELSAARGFWDVFEDTLRDLSAEWPTTGSLDFSRALNTLDESKMLDRAPSDARRDIFTSLLRRSAYEIYDWRPFNSDIRAGIRALARLITDETLLKTLRYRISTHPRTTPAGEIVATPESMSDWAQTIELSLQLCRAQNIEDAETFRCDIKLSPSEWRDFFAAAAPVVDQKLFVHLPLDQTAAGVLSELIRAVNAEQFRMPDVMLLRSTLSALPAESTVDINPLAEAISARLRRHGELESPEVDSLLLALRIKYGKYRGAKVLGALVSEGFIHHHLNTAFTRRSNELVGLILAILFQSNPEFPAPPNSGASLSGHSHLLAMLSVRGKRKEALERFEAEMKGLWGIAAVAAFVDKDPKKRAWFLDSLSAKCKSEVNISDMPKETAIKLRNTIKGLLNSNDDDKQSYSFFLETILKREDVRELLLSENYVAANIDLYISLLQTGGDPNTRIRIFEKLRSIEDEAWRKELENPTELSKIAFSICETHAEDLRLGDKFFDALEAHIEKSFAANAQRPASFDHINSYSLLLPDSYRRELQRRILKIFIRGRENTPSFCFDDFPPKFFEPSILLQEDELISGLFERAIISRNLSAARWVADCIDAHHGIADANYIANESVLIFKDRLKRALPDPAFGEIHQYLSRMASSLSVQID